MLTVTPPKGFKDVSEYSFSTDLRHVIVRYTHELGSPDDLLSVANDFAAELKEYLHAENVQVSHVADRVGGGSFVTVQGTFPKQQAITRSAFILMPTGTGIQLILRAKIDDAGANDEFLSLVRAVHATPPQTQTQSMQLAAPDDRHVVHHAGPTMIVLPSQYQNHTLLKYRNDAGTVLSVKYEQKNEPDAIRAKAKGVVGGRYHTTDDRGQTFSYESGDDPWAARSKKLLPGKKVTGVKKRTAVKAAAPESKPASIKAVQLAPNKRVTIRVHGHMDNVNPSHLANQMLKGIKLEDSSAPAASRSKSRTKRRTKK